MFHLTIDTRGEHTWPTPYTRLGRVLDTQVSTEQELLEKIGPFTNKIFATKNVSIQITIETEQD